MSVTRETDPAGVGQPGMIGAVLRAWWLRVGLAVALAGAGGAIHAWVMPMPVFVVVLVASGAATVQWPQTHAPGIFLGACAFAVLVEPSAGIEGWTFAAVFGLHAVHVLASLSALTPWQATVERAALRPAMVRFASVQAACQLLVALALAMTTL